MTIKTTFSLTTIAAGIVASYLVVSFILANAWIIWALLVLVGSVGGWIGYIWIQIFTEKLKTIQAERKSIEIKGRVIDTDKGTWFIQHFLSDGSTDLASLHNNPLWQINGHREPVTQAELFAWQAYNRRGSNDKGIQQLQTGIAQLPPPQLDFFAALTDPLQAYAVIGPQRIGKSLLLQQLTARLIDYGQTCVVIGTKATRGEWLNCERYIGGPDDATVSDALDQYYALSEQRIKADTNRPLITIVLDDWLNTAEMWPDVAERFFVEAATRMLTAGIVPYFVLQSDSKTDWGIKHGAQLKNNFTHLMLNAPRENGRIDHSRIRASITYPGDKSAHPVQLPYSQAIEPDLVIAPRTCLVCGGSVSEKQVYCSPACRQKAYRDRVTP